MEQRRPQGFPRIKSPALDLDDRTESPGLLHIQDPVTVGFKGPGTPLLRELALIPVPVPSMTSVPFSDYNV